MNDLERRTDLPVLVLHNIDHSWEPEEIKTALNEIKIIESSIQAEGHPVANLAIEDADLQKHLKDFDPSKHIVLNWCESLPGIPRSEAMVAQTLDALSFAYTGSPPDILTAAWDKGNVKRLLDLNSIPTPQWQVFESPETNGWDRFPAIVKPSCEHCSYGVTSDAVVTTKQQLGDRVAYVLDAFQEPALVEDFIDGREFHVSMWGNGTIEMLPPAEMDFGTLNDVHDRLCTYDAKFNPGTRLYEQIEVRVPAPLSPTELATIEKTARATYAVMGCRDYARLDMRLRNGIFYILDINPNPDISSDTSMVTAAGLVGYSYGAMLSRLINLAALRHPRYGHQQH